MEKEVCCAIKEKQNVSATSRQTDQVCMKKPEIVDSFVEILKSKTYPFFPWLKLETQPDPIRTGSYVADVANDYDCVFLNFNLETRNRVQVQRRSPSSKQI